MTNPSKIYDTTPNLNHLKSQLISTTSNAYISDNSQPILFKLWILPHYHYHTKSQVILQLKISKSHIISTISNAYISNNSQPIWINIWILHVMTSPNKVYDTT